MQVLEIGPSPVVKTVYPETTFFVGIGAQPVRLDDAAGFDFGADRIRQLRALLISPDFDAIFLTRFSHQRDAVGLRALARLAFSRRAFARGVPAVRIFGDRLLRFGTSLPIVLHDPSDAPLVPQHAIWLWQRAAVIFKREMPPDRWRLFMRTAHPDLPTPRFRKLGRYQAILEKVNPISLGLSVETERAIPPEPVEKTTDIFFAGSVDGNSYLRRTGLAELLSLRRSGLTIDVAEQRLARPEFFSRCRRACLVWSPEGLGHDTFRHYEAAACGSVPLINRPGIVQYAPFRDGETAFFYDPEPGGLSAAVRRALATRSALAAMGQAARSHVLRHHAQRARVDHMLGRLSQSAT